MSRLPALPRRPAIPSVRRGPVFRRGPKPLQSAVAEPGVPVPGPKPTSGPLALATEPEWYVYWALQRLGKRPGIDFEYRHEVKLPWTLALAAQIDFRMIDGSQIGIEVQGIYWHYERGTEKIRIDEVRRTLLENSGWHIIFLDEDDVLRNPIYYVSEALAGREHSRSVRS